MPELLLPVVPELSLLLVVVVPELPELPLLVVASLSCGAVTASSNAVSNAVSNAAANCCRVRVCPAAPSGWAGASGVVTDVTAEAPAAASAGSTCAVRRKVTSVSSGNTAWGLLVLTGAPNATSVGGKSISAPAARHGAVLFASASSATVTCWPARPRRAAPAAATPSWTACRSASWWRWRAVHRTPGN